jgi:5-methylcytosine-specific restriction protein A
MPEAARRNPDWEWDEIVLACDLVMRNGRRSLPAENPQVIELSELLQRMTIHPREARRADFRNPNGVGRKTADIATVLPGYSGRPTNGSRRDKEVIASFIAEPDVMHALAESIRKSVAEGEPADFPRGVGYENESEMEGRYQEDQQRAGSGRVSCLPGLRLRLRSDLRRARQWLHRVPSRGAPARQW